MTPPIYPWQERQWERVVQWADSGQWPHALLLVGPAHTGKLDFARAMTQYLLCLRDPPAGMACGECRSCQLYSAQTHPDFTVLTHAEAGKTIGIDGVRGLIGNLTLTASLGARKAAHIFPADAMTVPAANALLKTLEEPPGETVVVLVTDRMGALPKTIVSRCQRVVFPIPDEPIAKTWLAPRLGSETDTYLRLANGRPMLAVSYSEDATASNRDEVFLSLSHLLSRADCSPLSVAKGWQAIGLIKVTEWLMLLLGDLIKLKTVAKPQFLANPDLCESMQDLGGRLDLVRLFEMFDEVSKTHTRQAKFTGLNEQLGLEALAIRVRALSETD